MTPTFLLTLLFTCFIFADTTTEANTIFIASSSPTERVVTTTSTVQAVVTKTVTYTTTSISTASSQSTSLSTSPVPIVTSTYTVTETSTMYSTTTWAMPAQISDLTPFNVTSFPGNHSNLQIVQGNDSSLLQIFYPKGSINPSRKPQGGAEFYAAPLPEIYMASTANLTYAAYFPTDFEFVKGGKMPGLYGGHQGCSGGNAATDCFSTRLMWRENGCGEAYLYIPKKKQTAAFCNDPQSVCDSEYGLSIGRCSFTWASGAWTEVSQMVRLNTPGKQDGWFILVVQGVTVIDRRDVNYRDAPGGNQDKDGGQHSGGLISALLGLNQRYWQARTPVSNQTTPILFAGLFFSTFFGGHENSYATPRDQFVWFSGFSMSST
ncbi:hypothetical protein C8J56DRAFT_323412 [Mycena floridula]|nr:hypothetical protein C8J56DRAFT_323412 [Mycena floridula]